MNKEKILRALLDAMHKSGAGRAASPMLRGIGAIFMLHHITPDARQSGFAPNGGLEITPGFLENVIQFVRSRGYLIVSIKEAVQIITGKIEADAPFAVFTIDDGFRDNLEHGLPVFKANDCPFTIFAAPKITDGVSELWWRGLEAVIAGNQRIKAEIGDQSFNFPATSDAERNEAYATLYPLVRYMEEHEQRRWITGFCENYGVDLPALCASSAMNWDELRQIAAEPLCTIGAHTMNHFAVARLEADEALAEMVQSRDRIADELGKVPDFFAYPYGDEASAGPRDFALAEKAGFKAAVTTRKGLVYEEHSEHLMALPRLSLNGGYQQLKYVDVLMTGLPFALMNRFRKVNAA